MVEDFRLESYKKKAKERFKEHIKKMEGENMVLNYLIAEFTRWKWKLVAVQRQGHRTKYFNGGNDADIVGSN